MKIDSKSLEAINRLGHTLDGRFLHSALAAELDKAKADLIGAPMDYVQRLQGRALVLKELLDLLPQK